MMNDSPISLETNKKLNISSVLWHQPAAVCSCLDQVFPVRLFVVNNTNMQQQQLTSKL